MLVSRRKKSAAVLLCAVLAGAGCKSTYEKSLDKAAKAQEDGDHFLAAKHFRKACKEKPESDACVDAKKALERGVDESLRAAIRSMDRGRIMAAAEPLEEAAKNAPDHPKVTTF